MLEMSKYYQLRKEISKLYNENDILNSNPICNDLCSSVLEVRDKNRCILSMSTDISNHNISIELDENTDIKKKDKIISELVKRIGYFICNNAEKVGINPDSEDFNSLMDNKTNLFCDISLVGNSISINL